MKYYIFGRNFTFLNKPILDILKSNGLDFEYLGEKVDLSKIPDNLEYICILILNPNILNINFKKLNEFIEKNKNFNVFVARKVKTFGCVLFKPNKEIDKFLINKLYIFAGILCIKKENFKNKMSEMIKNLDKTTKVYILRRERK